MPTIMGRAIEVPGPSPSASPSSNATHTLDLDSFPVGVAVRALRLPQTIGYAAAYALLAIVLLVRLLAPSRPRDRQRRGSYWCFAVLCFCRISMFVLGSVVQHRIATGVSPNWVLVLVMDMLSTATYAAFCAAVYALSYSWRGRATCCFYVPQNETSHWVKTIAVYMLPVLVGLPAAAGSIVRLIAASPSDTRPPNATLYDKGMIVAQVGTIAASALSAAACFAVIPYTAYKRWKRMSQTLQVDHAAVADMIRNKRIAKDTRCTAWRAALLLWGISLCLLPGAVWRIVLAFTAHQQYAYSWARTPVALGVLSVAPELLAVAAMAACDFNGLDSGPVRIWKPWGAHSSSEKGISYLRPATEYCDITNLTYAPRSTYSAPSVRPSEDKKPLPHGSTHDSSSVVDLQYGNTYTSTFSHDSSEIGTAH